jgi:type I restriction enzyme R subunit
LKIRCAKLPSWNSKRHQTSYSEVDDTIDINSTQLAEALNSGCRIIITTLQKFSFVLDKIKDLPKRNYALIVDAAHSSRSGESATNLRRVLAASSLEEAEQEECGGEEYDPKEEVLKAMTARGPQKNMSFFAFTATPKHKTLEMFGTDDLDGKPQPFHLYSMRQAIEEGFILDVLQNYTTYKTFYKLAKAIEEDPELDRKKVTQEIARYVSLHPPQPRPEDRGDGRAFQELHLQEDRRQGKGDGCHSIALARRPIQTGVRQISQGERLLDN